MSDRLALAMNLIVVRSRAQRWGLFVLYVLSVDARVGRVWRVLLIVCVLVAVLVLLIMRVDFHVTAVSTK